MAALAAAASAPPVRIKLFDGRPRHLNGIGGWQRCSCKSEIPPRLSMKVSMSEFSKPEKLKEYAKVARERLWETVPNSIKSFPWREAEDKLLHRIVLLGHKVFKWSFIAFFIASSVSDFAFAVTKNTELLVPLGLLVGCLGADFLKEISMEFFSDSEDKKVYDLRQLTTTGCIFLLVKFISLCFALRSRVFLLHVANGGLMQVLWLWINPRGEKRIIDADR